MNAQQSEPAKAGTLPPSAFYRLPALFLATALACLVLAGCKTAPPSPLITLGVQASACALAQSKPESVPYIKLAGEVFVEFSGGELPSPDALSVALSDLPGGTLTSSQQQLVWLGAVAAYQLIYRPDLTEEQADKIRTTLQRIGLALKSGAECGSNPKLFARDLPVAPQDFSQVSRAVAEALR